MEAFSGFNIFSLSEFFNVKFDDLFSVCVVVLGLLLVLLSGLLTSVREVFSGGGEQ